MKVIRVYPNNLTIIASLAENFFVRPARPLSASHAQKLLTDDRTYILAAIANEEAVGYVLCYRFPSLYSNDYLAYLYDIEVSVNHRRKGAGRLLIKTLLTHLKADDVSELWLGTATDNTAGQAFFSSTGAVKSGETFNDFSYQINAQ